MASLVWAVGGKAPGAHHSRNAVEDPALEPLSPRAPCPGSDVGCPWIQSLPHGHREQGARFWLPEHQRAARPDEGTHKPAPSLLLPSVGSRAGTEASHAWGALPCAGAKAKPGCHQGQPERRWMMGCGCCRAKGASPRGGIRGWGLWRRAGTRDEFASLRHNPP